MGATLGYEGAPTRTLTYECQCVYDGQPGPTCRECKGTGQVHFENAEHDLHVCYSTLGTIFRELELGGLDPVCGSVNATVVEYQLEHVADASKVPYFDTLLTMARAASKAGQLLSWG